MYMNLMTCVLEMRGAGWERETECFPWGGLCLNFNMLFLSLKAPATAPGSFVISAPVICVVDEISYQRSSLFSLNGLSSSPPDICDTVLQTPFCNLRFR